MKWQKIEKKGIGAFGYEIYQNTENVERFLVKIFIYDTPVMLSGDKEILSSKIAELSQVFQELQKLFPNDKTPF